MTARVEQARGLGRRDVSLAFSLLFVVIVVSASRGADPAVAVYALSFWHYYLYWLAYRYGAVALDVFKRDAVVMKAVALAALGHAYLAAPPDFLSLAVVGAGFLLNVAAARALGADRTYYGREVAGLPPLRIAAFPYSRIAHPMLVGNVVAYGGTLVNADFRGQWWPLACAHVALNLGLLAMERYVTPLRRGAGSEAAAGARGQMPLAGCGIVAAGAATGGALGYAGGQDAATFVAAGLGAGAAGYACVLFHCYARPPFVPGGRRDTSREGSG
ncbi:MAG: methyltransferase [Burkholderiales bacterium]